MKKEINPMAAVAAVVVVLLVVLGYYYWSSGSHTLPSIRVTGPDGKRHMSGMKAGGGGPGAGGSSAPAAGN